MAAATAQRYSELLSISHLLNLHRNDVILLFCVTS